MMGHFYGSVTESESRAMTSGPGSTDLHWWAEGVGLPDDKEPSIFVAQNEVNSPTKGENVRYRGIQLYMKNECGFPCA